MAVVAMWKCDRDDRMFENKKDADNYDRMLELAENFSVFLQNGIEGLSDKQADEIGLLLSTNKDVLVAACKGKPAVLLDTPDEEEEAASNITPLAAKA